MRAGLLIQGGVLCSLLLGAGTALAQTTAAIRGLINGPDSTPAGNTTVVITDTRTGSSRTLTTAPNGAFNVRGLSVGGPYSIAIDSPVFSDQTYSGIFLSLGDTYNFAVTLQPGAIESIEVTAAALSRAEVATGPSSSFTLDDLQALPAINRDIRDVLRIDPRIYIDAGFVDAVQCAGANPRFNSLTVDGVRLNDNFGLNSSGYPTERMPFSYDAIQQISVELAPFDVQYGGFSACNINSVTKSGGNEFSGSMFYDYTSNDLRGDSLEGQPLQQADFNEDRFGGYLGGPLVRDKLFFFISYEELNGSVNFDRGAAGSSGARIIPGVSQAQVDEIAEIARSVYGYDPGGFPTSAAVEDQKYMVKLDWQVNDYHKASFTYNYNDGFSIAQSDNNNSSLEFSNHFYERGAELKSYVAQVFSDWNDSFSTELRMGHTKLDNRQDPLGGTEFGEFQITTQNDHDGDGIPSRATVYLGADDSRHANVLYYESDFFKVSGSYLLGDHVISGGLERETLDVFNMFIQEAEGEFRFASIEDFRLGKPGTVIYENAAPSNIPENAAASFGYSINTAYLQDEFLLANGELSLVAGLRYDWYESDDVPRNNANVAVRYGFSNQQNFDGLDLLQPRLGFEWNLDEHRLSVHGGVGLYSGGNPNVWLSNNYSNDGVTQVERQLRGLDTSADSLFTLPHNGSGRPGYDIPQSLVDEVASGSADSGVNVVDPGFKLPSAWKYSIGAVWSFDLPGSWGADYQLSADYLYSDMRDSAVLTDLTLERVGQAPDGRPIYRGIDRLDPDCAVPTASACGGRVNDFMLTNVQGKDGSQQTFSLGLSKQYDFGLMWALGYAYNKATDVNPMTSSVAYSNYSNVAVSDPNNPGAATSNYEIPHRFILRLQYEKAFWDDNLTRVSLFGSRNQGRGYAYTFASSSMFGDSISTTPGRGLLYVPTGPNDPAVVFGPDFNQEAFFRFVADEGLSPGIMQRNSLHSDWWTRFDLRIDQELPGMRGNDKFAAFVVIENLGNLLNDDWGVLREASFPLYQAVVDATLTADGQYQFNQFLQPNAQGRVTEASLWEARIGLRYSF